jgi:biopolymer transport protein ExbD
MATGETTMGSAVQREPALIGGIPVIGVLLALLGLLLVAAPPLSRSLQSSQAPVARELRLQVAAGGDYLLDGRRMSQDTLAAALLEARRRSPDLRLRIAGADDGDYRGFVGALAVAERVGVRNIGSEMR